MRAQRYTDNEGGYLQDVKKRGRRRTVSLSSQDEEGNNSKSCVLYP